MEECRGWWGWRDGGSGGYGGYGRGGGDGGMEGMEGWRDGGDGGVEGIATRVLVRACTISDESVSRCMRASILVRACVQ